MQKLPCGGKITKASFRPASSASGHEAATSGHTLTTLTPQFRPGKASSGPTELHPTCQLGPDGPLAAHGNWSFARGEEPSFGRYFTKRSFGLVMMFWKILVRTAS